MNFAAAADELRRQEIARLTDAIIPRLEALRSMTAPAFRSVIAEMLRTLGHTVELQQPAPQLTTTEGRAEIRHHVRHTGRPDADRARAAIAPLA